MGGGLDVINQVKDKLYPIERLESEKVFVSYLENFCPVIQVVDKLFEWVDEPQKF